MRGARGEICQNPTEEQTSSHSALPALHFAFSRPPRLLYSWRPLSLRPPLSGGTGKHTTTTPKLVQKKPNGALCRAVRGERGTCRSYLLRPAPITSLSALLSFDLIHTRKRRSGGGSGRGGTYASLGSGAAGNILTSSRKKPLNIAEKNRLREGAFLSCTLFAKFHSPAPLTKSLIMRWP